MHDLVIYHAGCWDGFCCAWLFHRWDFTVETIPAQYGDDSPLLTNVNRLYIVDFSYPKDVLKKMASQVTQVIVMDHHKTAKDDLEDLVGTHGNLSVQFDMSRSGAHMVWDYLFPESVDTPHWLVRYTEDRDLWKWELPYSQEVNCALRTYPLDFMVWDHLSELKSDDLVEEGKAVLRYKRQLVEQHIRFARLAHFGVPLAPLIEGAVFFREYKYSVPAVNCSTADLQSEVAGQLAEDHDFGAVWVDRGDGTQLWSLRSRDGGIDVGELAKSYGGGGHPRASGFVCDAGTIKLGKPVS